MLTELDSLMVFVSTIQYAHKRKSIRGRMSKTYSYLCFDSRGGLRLIVGTQIMIHIWSTILTPAGIVSQVTEGRKLS